jgi:hypothetical protein
MPDALTARLWLDGTGAGAPARRRPPLVISDHADWRELTRTITETGAHEV